MFTKKDTKIILNLLNDVKSVAKIPKNTHVTLIDTQLFLFPKDKPISRWIGFKLSLSESQCSREEALRLYEEIKASLPPTTEASFVERQEMELEFILSFETKAGVQDNMLNPGYKVIAKKEAMELPGGISFKCPHCKHPFLALQPEARRFVIKCQKCNYWIRGEKLLDNDINNL